MLTIKHFNTWAASLEQQMGKEYWEYLWKHAQEADILHFSEVHSCTDPSVPVYVNPEDAGHRVGPLHVRQLQRLQRLLRSTHNVYHQPQMNGLHDLDATHQSVQYGNVTAVRKGLTYDIIGGMVYRRFNEFNEQYEGGKPAAKSIQSVLILKDEGYYQSVSFHGHWDKRSKMDTPERQMQCINAMRFAQAHRDRNPTGVIDNPKLIIGGDFNLTSQCEVLEILRDSPPFPEGGGIILNHEFGIEDTRTQWYPPEKPSREADFVIVDPRILVERFSIDDTAPSDHAMITTVLR